MIVCLFVLETLGGKIRLDSQLFFVSFKCKNECKNELLYTYKSLINLYQLFVQMLM